MRRKRGYIFNQLCIITMRMALAPKDPHSLVIKLQELQNAFPHFSFNLHPGHEGVGSERKQANSRSSLSLPEGRLTKSRSNCKLRFRYEQSVTGLLFLTHSVSKIDLVVLFICNKLLFWFVFFKFQNRRSNASNEHLAVLANQRQRFIGWVRRSAFWLL